ncbi:MAG TPA: NAD-dependent epimerase/dehydratase family protein [Symbiobacteriaceae bacterium]|nr:NAD-dependent epimerase/dehydratase family protein [Symbiobacteriaceae bacterium]
MILVTGATGYIGEQLVRRLVTGPEKVRILVRSPEKACAVFGTQIFSEVDIAKGDLGDAGSLAAAVRGVDRVYHCASWISYKAPWEKVRRVNVEGAVNLLEACVAAGVRRVVHMSSIAAGGPAPAGVQRQEDDPPVPLNDPYGRSKLEQEQAVLGYGARGVEVVVVRPSAVYGPGDPTGINILLKLVARRWLRFYLGSRHTSVNVVPVKDVVAGSIAAMERGRPGEVYNLVGPDMTHQELFRILAAVSGGREPAFAMPVSVLLGVASAVAAVAGLFGTPPVHPNDIRSWTANWAASGEKARRELGLEPSDPRVAWAETFRWMQSLR